MADYLTHDLLGSEVIQSSRGAVHARLTEYPEAFRWGCQGPDPFFYRRLWEGGGPYHPLANRMHEEDTAGLFYAMARYAMEQSGWEREVCTAYLDGFLCHFLQGKGESRNPGVTCGTVHGQVETDIDIALYSLRGGRHISDFHPGDEHHLPALQKEAIAAMLCTVIRQVYDVELPQTEAEAAFYRRFPLPPGKESGTPCFCRRTFKACVERFRFPCQGGGASMGRPEPAPPGLAESRRTGSAPEGKRPGDPRDCPGKDPVPHWTV